MFDQFEDDFLKEQLIPFFANANDLTKLKVTCKFFNKLIKTHSPIQQKCVYCKNSRFSVYFVKEDPCNVKDCMVLSKYFLKYKYCDNEGNPICSLTCAIRSH